ncbi:hypothetical protein BD847_0235 [Flavobacterium cutihirudinis]|uniref:Uncharacterized protein n=1 Tax=Flavobacterium cutihirudinis TaxID=1265740 RepID=A0A3D9FZB3_9FLAO|nr:hypothetical protein [Flavobacterium cutihirudinis]RED26318.1 hypothetical protein BD847_0235 [Flavobacterium cutihirudinis]
MRNSTKILLAILLFFIGIGTNIVTSGMNNTVISLISFMTYVLSFGYIIYLATKKDKQ